MPVDSFCDKLSFFFACRNDFAEEIAKFRAARRIWAKIVKETFGSQNEDSMKLKFHTQTSGETLTAQQPMNNAVRVAIQALAAVLGGTQSLHTNSYDEALGLPTERAATIALRTQQIIAEESGVTKTVDPVGGSWYIERLTDELESLAMEELERVEKMGGALSAIKQGYIQNEIQKSAYRFQKEVDSGQRVIVGVNKYTSDDGRRKNETTTRTVVQRISNESARRQIQALRRFRASRDKAKLEKALSSLLEAADRKSNLMPSIIAATRERATTGEISDTLRKAFGEYRARVEI